METADIIDLYFLQCKYNCLTLRITEHILKRKYANISFPLMLSFKYSGLFNVLEMPLQTSTSMWLNSKILSLVLFKMDNGLNVRPPYPAD